MISNDEAKRLTEDAKATLLSGKEPIVMRLICRAVFGSVHDVREEVARAMVACHEAGRKSAADDIRAAAGKFIEDNDGLPQSVIDAIHGLQEHIADQFGGDE